MPDGADYEIDARIESEAAHLDGRCERGCPWCLEELEWEEDELRQARIDLEFKE